MEGGMRVRRPVSVLLFIVMLLGVGAISAAAADARVADAVMSGDKDVLRALPSDHANINAPQPDGTTALHWAARRDDLAAADALIKAGADVNAQNRYGVTPINLAATNGSAAMIRKLLDAGVDANSANPGGETALMTAARTGKVDAVTLLLDRGAAVNAREGVRGQTALMWAVLENHPAVVQLLIAKGADINAQTNVSVPDGTDGVPRAASGDIGAHGPGIYRSRAVPSPSGAMTALLFAAREGNLEMARILVDARADL